MQLNNLQDVLLRTHNRVLVSINEEANDTIPVVYKKHHPIARLQTGTKTTNLYFACHNKNTILSDVFRNKTWVKNIDLSGIIFERCVIKDCL